MQELFHNITTDLVEEESIRERIESLWTEAVPAAVRKVVDGLLEAEDVLADAAVFDRFSYSRTTWGSSLSAAFDGLSETLLVRARKILADVWGVASEVRPAVREPLIACALHVIWRAVDIDDAEFVLHALREESDARVVFPAVSAAGLLVPLDSEFATAVTPLLIPVVARDDLPPITRRMAIGVLAERASPQDIDELADVVKQLPVADAAGFALDLLDASPRHRRVVNEIAATWPDGSGREAQLVLGRLQCADNGETQ